MDYMSQSVSEIDADSPSLDQWRQKRFISGEGHFPLNFFGLCPHFLLWAAP